MKFFIQIFCALAIISLASAGYPSSIEKCKNGDGSCMAKVATDLLRKYSAGFKDLNIVPFEPMHVIQMLLSKDPSSAVNVDISFFDVDVYGFKNAEVVKISGFQSDLSGRNELILKVPNLRFVGKYKIEGKVLILPIVGDGPYEVVAKNVELKYSFDLKPVEKKGHIYATLDHVKLELNPGHIHVEFKNLFNGDKALGDNMNAFANEHWSELYEAIRPPFTKANSLLIKEVINAIFEKYPYAEYFL